MGKHEARMQNQVSERMTEINEEYIENLAFSSETAAQRLEEANSYVCDYGGIL